MWNEAIKVRAGREGVMVKEEELIELIELALMVMDGV